jgi:hypothetical protein
MSQSEVQHVRKKEAGRWCKCPKCKHKYDEWLVKNNERKRLKRQQEAKDRSRKRLNPEPLISLLKEEKIINDVIRKYSSELYANGPRYGLDVYVADKICVSIGLHPLEVFGDEWLVKALQEETE